MNRSNFLKRAPSSKTGITSIELDNVILLKLGSLETVLDHVNKRMSKKHYQFALLKI